MKNSIKLKDIRRQSTRFRLFTWMPESLQSNVASFRRSLMASNTFFNTDDEVRRASNILMRFLRKFRWKVVNYKFNPCVFTSKRENTHNFYQFRRNYCEICKKYRLNYAFNTQSNDSHRNSKWNALDCIDDSPSEWQTLCFGGNVSGICWASESSVDNAHSLLSLFSTLPLAYCACFCIWCRVVTYSNCWNFMRENSRPHLSASLAPWTTWTRECNG